MDILDYLLAYIVVDGQRCQEYDVDISEPAHSEANDLEKLRLSKEGPRTENNVRVKVEKYIQCISDSHFEVETGLSADFNFGLANAVVVRFLLNGKYAESILHIREEVEDDWPDFNFNTCQGTTLDRLKVIRKFKFGSIKTSQSLKIIHCCLTDLFRGRTPE